MLATTKFSTDTESKPFSICNMVVCRCVWDGARCTRPFRQSFDDLFDELRFVQGLVAWAAEESMGAARVPIVQGQIGKSVMKDLYPPPWFLGWAIVVILCRRALDSDGKTMRRKNMIRSEVTVHGDGDSFRDRRFRKTLGSNDNDSFGYHETKGDCLTTPTE